MIEIHKILKLSLIAIINEPEFQFSTEPQFHLNEHKNVTSLMEILLNNLKITRSNIKEWQNTFVNQLNKNILNLN